MTLFFTNHQIQIYRKRRKGSSNRYGMSATFTAYNSDIQPASADRVQLLAEGRIGAVFTAFVDVFVDIKESDQVVVLGGVYDGKRFSVQGVQHWQGAGLLDYVELILVAQDG